MYKITEDRAVEVEKDYFVSVDKEASGLKKRKLKKSA